MTLLRETSIDFDLWPDLRRARPAPARAAIARRLLGRAARSTGIRVDLPDGSHLGSADGPVMRVIDVDAFLDRLGRSGKIGFGESYMAREWDSPDLASLLTRLAANLRRLVPPRLQWVRRFYDPDHPSEETNDRDGAKKNISHHYDLSNEMFSLFLDPTMSYSSALFEGPAETLEAAQVRKIEQLLDSTRVTRGSTVLEIGTGWGELALRAAKRGAAVRSVTLSEEQARLARERIARAGLDQSVEVVIEDYRDVSGRYDAVLSVEMIEAVGESFWPEYFEVLDRRTTPGGRVGIQSILMSHEDMVATRGSWGWVHKYIFPGGLIPSMTAIGELVRENTTLVLLAQRHFGASYAETLRRWRDAFDARDSEVSALGFDATFRRMWDFYLAYSEAGFRSGYLDVAQLVLGRDHCRSAS